MSIRIETRGIALHATLDAPATRNALTDAMVEELGQALQQAQARPELRAFVVRGAGGHFCAGGDFSRFQALMAQPAPSDGPDPIAGFNRSFGHLLERLADSPLATIAVVEGAAMGGGVGLAAACDLVLAASGAQFAMPEVTLGLPPAQIAPFVAERIGPQRALQLMLTGHRIGAEQAQALGLVDETLWPDALQARLDTWLADLLRAEPAALRATKRIVRASLREPRAQVLDEASSAFAASLRSGTALEGLGAFTAKRPPRWAEGSR